MSLDWATTNQLGKYLELETSGLHFWHFIVSEPDDYPEYFDHKYESILSNSLTSELEWKQQKAKLILKIRGLIC